MTQEMINKEKEELMSSIKKKLRSYHALNVIDLIFIVVISVFFLIFFLANESSYGFEFFGYLLLIFVALGISFIMWKYTATLKSTSDAKEYLQLYDKFQRYSLYVFVIPFVIVVAVAVFLLWRPAIGAAVVIGWAILIISFVRSGLYKNRDIERLRELVEQEDSGTQD